VENEVKAGSCAFSVGEPSRAISPSQWHPSVRRALPNDL
jgi:hypothetical protein